jgi:hypothetical protein
MRTAEVPSPVGLPNSSVRAGHALLIRFASAVPVATLVPVEDPDEPVLQVARMTLQGLARCGVDVERAVELGELHGDDVPE